MLPIHFTFRSCFTVALRARGVDSPAFYRDHAFNEFLIDISHLSEPADIAIRTLLEYASPDRVATDEALAFAVVMFLDKTCGGDDAVPARVQSLWRIYPGDEHAYRDWISRWYDD